MTKTRSPRQKTPLNQAALFLRRIAASEDRVNEELADLADLEPGPGEAVLGLASVDLLIAALLRCRHNLDALHRSLVDYKTAQALTEAVGRAAEDAAPLDQVK